MIEGALIRLIERPGVGWSYRVKLGDHQLRTAATPDCKTPEAALREALKVLASLRGNVP